jgi:hypothetical protein
MRIEDIQLKESIQSWVAFSILVIAVVLMLFGVVGIDAVLIATSLYTISILMKVEKNFDEREIAHDTITVQRGDGVWIFRIANYKVHVDKKRAEQIARFLQMDPTSD